MPVRSNGIFGQSLLQNIVTKTAKIIEMAVIPLTRNSQQMHRCMDILIMFLVRKLLVLLYQSLEE